MIDACEEFHTLYDAAPALALRAPARLTVLGEHVDYVRYRPTASLTMASAEGGMLMLARPRADRVIRGASSFAEAEPFTFDLDREPSPPADDHSDEAWQAYLLSNPAPAPHWSNYVRGACLHARWRYKGLIGRGFDFLIRSGIRPRGGASSSSALAVLAGAALRQVNDIPWETRQEMELLARASAAAEWYTGTRGGAMDHLTICLARRDEALYLDYHRGGVESVPLLAPGLRWATFFSHPADKGRDLMLAYNERAAVAQIIIPALLVGDETDSLPAEIGLDQLARDFPAAMENLRCAFPALVRHFTNRAIKVRSRAQHHAGEARRVAEAVNRLRASDPEPWARLGELIDESHASLRDLYDVSTEEVERLREVICAAPGVYGARLVGGGFGGNVLALVASDAIPELLARVQRHYYDPRRRNATEEGAVLISTPGDGLSVAALNRTTGK